MRKKNTSKQQLKLKVKIVFKICLYIKTQNSENGELPLTSLAGMGTSLS